MRRLLRGIDAQFGNPHGRVGAVVAAGLNVVNRPLNRATVGALGLRPGERVLDVGFGGGVGVRTALDTQARVVAIDPSADMVRAGQRRFGSRAEVHRGTAAEPGEAAGSLHAAYAVNTVYFWPDVQAGLRGLHEALAPGGRLALGVESTLLARRAATRPGLPGTPEALAAAVAAGGFADVRVERAGRRGAVVVGVRP